MLFAMILLIVIGIVILILFSLCRTAALSDEYAELMRDPEYLVDEEEEMDEEKETDEEEEPGLDD